MRGLLVVVMMPVMMVMVMVMAMPTDFGRRRLRAFLDRRDGGGTGQRQRLGLLCRSGKDQYRTNCSESQNSRHLH